MPIFPCYFTGHAVLPLKTSCLITIIIIPSHAECREIHAERGVRDAEARHADHGHEPHQDGHHRVQ